MRRALYLLQLSLFKIEDNPTNGIFLLIGIGVVILAFFYLNRFNKKAVAKSNVEAATPKKLFSGTVLQRTAESLGLNAAQTKMLDFVLRTAAVTDPKTDMADPELIDSHFERAYQAIKERPDVDEEVQNRLALLFSTRNSIEAAQTARAGQSKGQVQRRFKRKGTVISCNLYTVRIEETGHKKERKMVVESRSVPGSIQDISVGGCAIKSNTSIPAGTRLKITFEHSGMPLAVLGQVLRLNQGTGTGTVMHVKFIKVPKKAMNSINAIVFDYRED
jgi:hypothetical protein